MFDYRVKFDQSGKIIYSNAPMIPAQHDQIDRYLPLFYDIEALEDFDLKALRPYECHIGNKKYFFHLDWSFHEIDNMRFYELLIEDRTSSYNRLQKERSKKNTLRLEQDYLIDRLNTEVEEKNEARSDNHELKTILEHTREGIIYQNQMTGEIVKANHKALELFSCQKVEELKSIQHIHFNGNPREEYDPKLFVHLWNKERKREAKEEVIKLNDHAQKEKYFSVRVVEEQALKLESLNIIFVSDITNEYQSKLELKNKNKELLQYIESNVQLEQFAHVASHDLRAPIITIKSFSNLLKEKCADRLNDNESKYLNIIKENADQMFSLVSDLLDYAQINSQKIAFKKTNLQFLLEGVIDSFRSIANQTNVTIEIVNRLPEIVVDDVKLKRVFQNLLSNAIKFADPTKKSFVKIDFAELDDKYEFMICDNGIGMKEGSVDIFQPYTKLNLQTEYEGNGMGLAICKNIIKQHKGEIYYKSTYGEGSRFVFSIPKEL